MDCEEIIYTGHAVARMFERKIQTSEIRHVIESGEAIKDYPDDSPSPSCLLLGWVKDCPLHVVVAFDEENKRCYVITCYIPDQSQWQSDFKSRRKL
jgi:Domain of unknown function (DUF4258)